MVPFLWHQSQPNDGSFLKTASGIYLHVISPHHHQPPPHPPKPKKNIYIYISLQLKFFYDVESYQGRAFWTHPWEVNYGYMTPLAKTVNRVIQGKQGRALYNSNYEILKEKGIH